MAFLSRGGDVYFRAMEANETHLLKRLLRGAIAVIVLALAAACQPAPTSALPTDVPFPTMTPGQVLVGQLSASGAGGSSPAEAVAQASRATPTPNYEACPAQTGTGNLPDEPDTPEEAAAVLSDYLGAGGTLSGVRDGLIDWDALGETGYVRDADLTGEGQPEVIIGYTAPDGAGTLLVLGCENGRYATRYESTSDGSAPPVMVWIGDVNQDMRSEMVASRRLCETADLCLYDTQILRWDTARGRFFNLLNEPVHSLEVPAVRDTDSDNVTELVIQLTTRGTTATGPLRTGVNIYDWNGTGYTLSIIQLDPPEYYIQYIHQADRLFAERNIAGAATLYQRTLDRDDLRYWFNDGPVTITTYTLYRLLLAYAYLEDPRLQEIITRINADYAVEEGQTADDQPVYIALAYTFINTMQARADLHTACESVQRIIEIRPQAMELLNRYGRYNPAYEALDLCPY
ncbi:hypothetical protein G4Y79_21000 [Phototrophicus methaneseepsis]|uniref:Uncharacterized protein n=1 Tax=Phototrophicus methaneseepsis TaxID=2710758 RepID=A0A7S8E861_9CHLR|nr:hypothetical protein [Phototrophicus methaneseepsis]QPC82136.1 hypothetical protein G4Y79_21000 [Phototrophicus methaneseepsis]